MARHFALELGTPIRFVALAWSEDWQIGFPSILLEPVVRYDAGGTEPRWLIEDVAEDLARDVAAGRPIDRDPHQVDAEQLRERGLSLTWLRLVAEAVVALPELRLSYGYRAVERWLTFAAGDGLNVEFTETVPPFPHMAKAG